MQNITKHIMTTFYQLIWLSSLYLKLSRTAMEEVVEEVVVVEMGGQKSVGDADMIGTDRWDDECLTSRIINTRSPSQCHLWFSDLRIKQPDCHHQPPTINKHLILSSSSSSSTDINLNQWHWQLNLDLKYEKLKYFSIKNKECLEEEGRGGDGSGSILSRNILPFFRGNIRDFPWSHSVTVWLCDGF